MPKINVYLPDKLAAAVRAAHVPVSTICQRALADAVRTVQAAHAAIASVRSPEFDPDQQPETVARMRALMTPRLQRIIATAGSPVTLLAALLADQDNLGVRILQGLGADAPALLAEAGGPPSAGPLAAAGWQVLAAGLEAATELGHSYLGSEHLLLGLAGPEGAEAATLLAAGGVTADAIRKAIPAAVAGAALGYQQAGGLVPPTVGDRVDELTDRLAALEARLGAAGL